MKQATPVSHTQPSTPAYPWLIILMSSLFLFYKYVLQVSPGVMTTELMQYFHLSAKDLGLMAAMYFNSYLAAQLISGPLLDYFGVRLISTLALLTAAMGLILFAHTSNFYLACLGRALIGGGSAFATVSYLKLAAEWFPPRQFGLVSGLLTVSVMFGALGGQLPLAILIEQHGWQHALSYCALLGFAFAALYFVIIRNTPPTAQHAQASQAFTWAGFWTVLKTPCNWFLMLYNGLVFTPLTILGTLWGNAFLHVAHGLSRNVGASIIGCLFVGLALGGPVWGWLADRYNKRYEVMYTALLLSFISLCTMLYVPHLSLLGLVLMMTLCGFGTSAVMLGFAIGRDVNPIALAACVIALVNSGDALLGSFSEPLVGFLLDQFALHHQYTLGAYQLALSTLPVVIILAGLCLRAAQLKQARISTSTPA